MTGIEILIGAVLIRRGLGGLASQRPAPLPPPERVVTAVGRASAGDHRDEAAP